MNPQLLALLLQGGMPQQSVVDKLAEGIGSASDALTRRQEQEQAMPLNVPIRQSKFGINNATANLIGQLLSQGAPPISGQGAESAFPAFTASTAADADAAQMKMQALGAAIARGNNTAGVYGALNQAGRDFSNAAGLNAIYGGVKAPMSVQERLGAQQTGQIENLKQVQSLLGLMSPEQINDPKLLETVLKDVPNMAATAYKADSDRSSAGASSIGKLLGDQANAQAAVQAADIKGKADIESAKIQKTGAGSGLTQTVLSSAQQKIQDNLNIMSGLDHLATNFNEDFFKIIPTNMGDLANYAEQWGVPMSEAQTHFNTKRAEFQTIIKDTYNQYRRSITGAAASEKELEMIAESIVNESNGPTEAKAKLVALMVKMETEMTLANKLIQHGAQIGMDVPTGNEEFGKLVEKQMMSEQAGKIREQVKASILQRYPSLNTELNASQQAPQQSPISKEDAGKQLASLGYIKGADGKWRKP